MNKQNALLSIQPSDKSLSMTRLILNRFLDHRLALTGLVVLLVLTIGALALPFYPYNPEEINLRAKFDPPSLYPPYGNR